MLLRALSEPEKLDTGRMEYIEDLSNTLFVSSISIAEIAIKSSIGNLTAEFDLVETVTRSGFEFLDFRAEEAAVLKDLPLHHKDPFDRMLIAQGLANGIPIMTDDPKFTMYECRVM